MKGITGHSALEAYRRVQLTPVNPAQGTQPAAKPAVERPPTEAAKVSISHEARELAAQGEAQGNSKKVENLKARIAEGSFKVNSHLVAKRMLDTLG